MIAGRSSGIYSQASAQSSRIGSTLSRNKSYPETNLLPPAYNSLNITGLGNGVESFDAFQPPKKELNSKNVCNESKLKINLDDGKIDF